jgi:predicted DNA-binding transcriptional regulator AlpA
MEDDKLLNTTEMAALMSVPESRLEKARVSGIDCPPFIKLGNLVRYPLADYKQWLGNRRRLCSTSEGQAA